MTDSIAALKAAYEKTTPGTWRVARVINVIKIVVGEYRDWRHIIADVQLSKLFDDENEQHAADAAFIVAAHTLTPALLAECERLRAIESRLLGEWYTWDEMAHSNWEDGYKSAAKHDEQGRAHIEELLGYLPEDKR